MLDHCDLLSYRMCLPCLLSVTDTSAVYSFLFVMTLSAVKYDFYSETEPHIYLTTVLIIILIYSIIYILLHILEIIVVHVFENNIVFAGICVTAIYQLIREDFLCE